MFGTIKTSGATWQKVGGSDKNIVDNVSKYVDSWPDGTTNGSAWTLKSDDPTSGTYFTKVLDSIWESYKDSIQKATGVSSLAKADVTEITLIPAKISRDNSTTANQNYHIDCTISVKCAGVFTAKFWVKEPGAENYSTTPVDAKSYASGSKVGKTGKITIGSKKVVNGVTYVLTGWYAENNDGGAKGDLIPDSSWSYNPSAKELADGTVNFYAEYVPMYSQVTVSKTVTGALGDKAKEFSFTLTVKDDSNGNEITGEMKAQKGSAEEFTIKSGNTFTLKDGESIVFTNVPTGATVTVTENDYTGTNGGYSTSYAVTGGSNTANPSTIKVGEATTFLLKHGDTITIANLPYRVEYTVTETAAEGYTTTSTGDYGTINAAEQTAAFTNNKAGSIDTGVGEGFKGGIILLKSIEHFIFQPAKEGLHNAIVVAVALSGHRLNNSVLLKFTTVECVLVLPALI